MHNVSIIIPAYVTSDHGLLWLDECIESAVMQRCNVVVYDDGSPVNIAGVIQKYSKHIDYYAGNNRGVSAARNQAVARVVTDLIFPLDCDDRLVPGAIDKLLMVWNGIPLYPDVRKFGLEDVPHYALLDFSCDHIVNHVGFSSVNVLHGKNQWKSIGGWNEAIDFYEDGEYNARLFARYCGERFPFPLVEYRIHDNQRTKRYKQQSAMYARQILKTVRSLDMACPSCGGKRRVAPSQFQTPVPVSTVNPTTLPGELEGRLLAQYVGGKGRGKHYYRGLRTKFPYKVIYGEYLYVDPTDIRQNSNDVSLFVRVETKQAAPAAPAAPAPVEAVVARSARKDVGKMPVVESNDIPDIANMSVRDIRNLDGLDQNLAKKLLILEKSGHNRSKVVAILESVIANG